MNLKITWQDKTFLTTLLQCWLRDHAVKADIDELNRACQLLVQLSDLREA